MSIETTSHGILLINGMSGVNLDFEEALEHEF